MARCTAAAVLVLAVFFGAPTPGRPDEALVVESAYRAKQQGESSAARAPTSLNDTRYAAAVETPTSVSLETIPPIEFISNGTDMNDALLYDDLFHMEVVDRFFSINARAAGDPEFQRREVQVLSCCFAEDEKDSCLAECINHFVASVDSGSAVTNETKSVLVCSALYELLDCRENNRTEFADQCMDYWRCYSSDPWLEAMWGVTSGA